MCEGGGFMRICEVAGKETAILFPITGVWMFQIFVGKQNRLKKSEWGEKIIE